MDTRKNVTRNLTLFNDIPEVSGGQQDKGGEWFER